MTRTAAHQDDHAAHNRLATSQERRVWFVEHLRRYHGDKTGHTPIRTPAELQAIHDRRHANDGGVVTP